MCDLRYPATDDAVDETEGEHLTYHGETIVALYSAENASPTQQGTMPYVAAVEDPASFGALRQGHGIGLSQNGSKRWARSNWTYRQILYHYYSDVEIEPATHSSDLVSFDISNRPTRSYVTSPGISVELRGQNLPGTKARLWTLDSSSQLVAGPWLTDTIKVDGWRHFFDTRQVRDTKIGGVRAEFGALNEGDTRFIDLGIDHTAPTLEATLQLAFTSGADLAIEAQDLTSGVERIGWSYRRWWQEAESVSRALALDEPTASGGRAIRLESTIQGSSSIVFQPISLEPSLYRAWVRLRASLESVTPQPLISIEVIDQTGSLRGVRRLQDVDLWTTKWTWYSIDIDGTRAYRDPSATELSVKVTLDGDTSVDVDAVFLATRPEHPARHVSIAMTPPEPIVVYGSDRADNVSLLRCAPVFAVPRDGPRLYLPIASNSQGFTGIQAQYSYSCTDLIISDTQHGRR
jgi:hypothetical protein